MSQERRRWFKSQTWKLYVWKKKITGSQIMYSTIYGDGVDDYTLYLFPILWLCAPSLPTLLFEYDCACFSKTMDVIIYNLLVHWLELDGLSVSNNLILSYLYIKPRSIFLFLFFVFPFLTCFLFFFLFPALVYLFILSVCSLVFVVLLSAVFTILSLYSFSVFLI